MTDVEICNVALSSLGLDRISSLASSSGEAVACNLHFQPSVNETLADHPWSWARKRSELAESAIENLTIWDHVYQLPLDMVRLISMHDEDGTEVFDYEVEGDKIYTDHDSITARYVYRVTDPSRFPAQFAHAVSMLIAHKLAMEFQQARSLANDHLQRYMMALEKAMNIDGAQTANTDTESDWRKIF